ncbi:MAG TPA: transglutaminase domain-containing protein, partial [Gammaproteobacteria bacterium]|nr:transglutaminase domain-containing protein [Gammaproteobacteria bacterium]
LNTITRETDPQGKQQRIQTLQTTLAGYQFKRSQQPFDPNHLPNKNLKPKPGNAPKQTKDEFSQAGLFDTPYAKLAALGDFTFDNLVGASDPAYLAASTEVTLSQAIQDQAAALNFDPVKIYHWVRNTIQWLPTMGAMQDADLTLSSKRGNSADISSLTLSLLRASGIPSRYVHGTIEIDKASFLNWAGGFTNINAAMEFVASGGIPVTPVTSAGQIVKVRIEHLWVEAAIDNQPSRGAKNFAADSWVQFDPSYKQYDYLTGPLCQDSCRLC